MCPARGQPQPLLTEASKMDISEKKTLERGYFCEQVLVRGKYFSLLVTEVLDRIS